MIKTFSLEIYIRTRERKIYHLHFKALQVPILTEVIGNYNTKRPDPDMINDHVEKKH